jgi:hypothetical protein
LLAARELSRGKAQFEFCGSISFAADDPPRIAFGEIANLSWRSDIGEKTTQDDHGQLVTVLRGTPEPLNRLSRLSGSIVAAPEYEPIAKL